MTAIKFLGTKYHIIDHNADAHIDEVNDVINYLDENNQFKAMKMTDFFDKVGLRRGSRVTIQDLRAYLKRVDMFVGAINPQEDNAGDDRNVLNSLKHICDNKFKRSCVWEGKRELLNTLLSSDKRNEYARKYLQVAKSQIDQFAKLTDRDKKALFINGNIRWPNTIGYKIKQAELFFGGNETGELASIRREFTDVKREWASHKDEVNRRLTEIHALTVYIDTLILPPKSDYTDGKIIMEDCIFYDARHVDQDSLRDKIHNLVKQTRAFSRDYPKLYAQLSTSKDYTGTFYPYRISGANRVLNTRYFRGVWEVECDSAGVDTCPYWDDSFKFGPMLASEKWKQMICGAYEAVSGLEGAPRECPVL